MRDARAQRVNEECAMLVLTQLAEQFFQKKHRGRRARFNLQVQRRHSSVRPRAKQSHSTILCRPASSSRSSSP